MIPSLNGRIQTRVFTLVLLGLPWTIVVAPLLPRPTDQFGSPVGLGMMYAAMFTAWFLTLAFGIVWELVYHGIQQLRWDRDFPSLFFGLAALIEFPFVAFWVWVAFGPPLITLILAFFPLWFAIWCFVQGPIRVLVPRWRFRGGRIL